MPHYQLKHFENQFVFGVKELSNGIVSLWGKIIGERSNNKRHICWAVESNGSIRLIRQDKYHKTWFTVSADYPEDAKSDAKRVFKLFFNEDGIEKPLPMIRYISF